MHTHKYIFIYNMGLASLDCPPEIHVYYEKRILIMVRTLNILQRKCQPYNNTQGSRKTRFEKKSSRVEGINIDNSLQYSFPNRMLFRKQTHVPSCSWLRSQGVGDTGSQRGCLVVFWEKRRRDGNWQAMLCKGKNMGTHVVKPDTLQLKSERSLIWSWSVWVW